MGTIMNWKVGILTFEQKIAETIFQIISLMEHLFGTFCSKRIYTYFSSKFWQNTHPI